MPMSIVIDTETGARGTAEDFVSRFTELWASPNGRAEPFGVLLSPDVRLIAPMTPTTNTRATGLRALQKVFDAAPDLRADVLGWSARENVVFIEMRFTATLGGRTVSWYNVDRFRFDEAGAAIERVAYFDPSTLRRALLRSPSGWLQAAKLLRR